MIDKKNINKIGIYIWELPYRYGGTESCAVKFAWALQQIFPNAFVQFVAEVYTKKDIPNNKSLIDRLNGLAGTNIDWKRAGLKPVLCSKKSIISRKIMYKKIENSSKGFDIFFYCSRGNFAFKAKKNIAIIDFPVWPIVQEKKREGKLDFPFLTKLKDKRYAKSYNLFLPNSKYTEYWLKKLRPDIDSKKIVQMYHPVLPIKLTGEPKEKAILAVSRIEKTKKLEALIEAYKKSKFLTENYALWIAGNRDIEDADYPERLVKMADGYNVHFFVSIPHDELVSLYNRATFFWHSKGYGIDENLHPDQLEHFGMTTVEAMNAKCIPIVINKGGQPEIVTEGTGKTWDTLEELASFTEEIAVSEEKIHSYSEAAYKRSLDFSMEDLPKKLEMLLAKI